MDGQTDGIAMAYTRYSIYAVAHKNVTVDTRKMDIPLHGTAATSRGKFVWFFSWRGN